MTTLSDLIAQTKRHLYTGYRVQMNRLTSSVTDSDSTVTVDFPLAALKDGARISVGLETMYVWAVDENSKTATVERGFDGTTPTAHDAGELVEVDPQFPAGWIADAINADLIDLCSPSHGLFKVAYTDFVFQPAILGYSIDASQMIDVPLDVKYEARGVGRDWPRVPSYRLARNMPTSEFPDGAALFLPQGGPDPGVTVRVWFKTPFAPLTALSDDVEVVAGLRARAHDLPPLGAAWRLLTGRAVKRSFTETQGDTRRPDEVSAAEVRAAPANLYQLRSERIMAEAAQLSREWPRYRKNCQ